MRILILISCITALPWDKLFSGLKGNDRRGQVTGTGTKHLEQTAQLATNVDVIEHEMNTQAISDDEIKNQLSQNAKETTELLKKIEKDKKSTFAELQTAIAANCATLKREYEIEIRLGTTVDKVVDKALAECVKAKAALHKRSMETVMKNLNKINEIYTDALRSKDVRQGCITVFNHMDAMIGTMSAANFLALPDPLSTRTLLSKKEADGLRSGMRKMANSVFMLHNQLDGNKCKQLKPSKLKTITAQVQRIIQNNNLIAIDDENQEKEVEKENGSRGMMMTISILFSLSLLICIGIGVALPKPAERMPHMSSRTFKPVNAEDNSLQIVLKCIQQRITDKYNTLKDQGNWSFENAWKNVKHGTEKIYEGGITLKDSVSKLFESDKKFPHGSARSQMNSREIIGSVKSAAGQFYDATVYYAKGIYLLHKKKNRKSRKHKYDYDKLISEDDDENIIFSTEESTVSDIEKDEYPKIEEDVEIPKNDEPVEESLSEKVKKVKEKMNKIEAAFQEHSASFKAAIGDHNSSEERTDSAASSAILSPTPTENSEEQNNERRSCDELEKEKKEEFSYEYTDYTEDTYTVQSTYTEITEPTDQLPELPERDYE